jgi:hypothetical protein
LQSPLANVILEEKRNQMTKKDDKIFRKIINDLSEDIGRIQAIRGAVGINPQYNFNDECRIIEYIFNNALNLRTRCDGTVISSSTQGWTVNYIRQHKKYKKDEEYSLNIYFSFVETDTYD